MRKLSIYALTTATLLAAILVGCTDAERASYGAFGSKSTITCYSGGKVILADESTGKVMPSAHGAGIYYKSSRTGRLMHDYADCLVAQE